VLRFFRVVRSEVLTAVVMKSTVFWDIMLCSLLKVSRHFEGTYCLHLQGRIISRARSQCASRWQAIRGTYRLHIQCRKICRACLAPAFTLVSCLAYSSTLKVETICSSGTSVDLQQTTRHCISEDSTLLYCLKLYSIVIWKGL
jgi:hypothetical protein